MYAELRALGHRSGFSLAALDDALSVIMSDETTEAFVNIDSPRGFDVAKRLTQLAIERGIDVPDAIAGQRDAKHEGAGDEDDGEDFEAGEDEDLEGDLDDDDEEDDDDAQ